MSEAREKCAVAGASLNGDGPDAARYVYSMLFALQHRGVEASGIAAFGNGALHYVRRPGMVRDVFQAEDLNRLQGNAAVGQNRYSTNGSREAHLQPVEDADIGFAFSHNGQYPDVDPFREYLHQRRYLTAPLNDSELGGTTLASKLHGERTIEEAVEETMNLAVGSYACTAAFRDSVFAFRDPHGIRPLELGRVDGGVVFASETCAFDSVGAEWVRSVQPGELVIARNGLIESEKQLREPTPHFDMFELVYFARHDSYLGNERVNEVRRRFGAELAGLHPPRHPADNSLVVPVPDTSVPAAEGYAEATGLPHGTAIIKNRYVGRTFMQPSQDARRSELGRKHTIITERMNGKHITLIDDSIVRGNTMPRLVQQVREAGALSVTVLIASPPVRFPDFYGIDTPSQDELMAANLTIEEMRDEIGCDYLGFLTVDAMVNATNQPKEAFSLAPFTGEYPIPIGTNADAIRLPRDMTYVE